MRSLRLLSVVTVSLAAAVVCCLTATTLAQVSFSSNTEDVEPFFTKTISKSGHTNNWAVLVCTSRFWFNYRHIANTLSIYRTVKRLGIPDSNIIMMLADDVACNPRNIFPATVFNNQNRFLDLYGENVEVDYRGYEVTVENFIRMLTGRVSNDTPRSKRLMSDDQSNILVYMTGHGGDEFLKFQDAEEISAYDLGDAFQQMYEKKRYNEILFMIDTCQANTMYTKIHSPNILACGSAQKGENSYSHQADNDIGVAVIDRFTYYNLEVLETIGMQSQITIQDLFQTYSPARLGSNAGYRSDLFGRPLDQVLVTDFFGSVANIELTTIQDQDLEKDEIKEKDSRETITVEQDTFNVEELVDQNFDIKNSSLEPSSPESSSPESHQHKMFEIGDPEQSLTLRYIVFVTLSVALIGGLAVGSSSFAIVA